MYNERNEKVRKPQLLSAKVLLTYYAGEFQLKMKKYEDTKTS
jgi:hypothetical protein